MEQIIEKQMKDLWGRIEHKVATVDANMVFSLISYTMEQLLEDFKKQMTIAEKNAKSVLKPNQEKKNVA